MKGKEFFKSFTVFEVCLWAGSVAAIVLSFSLCGNTAYYHLAGSLLGATALLLVAKGNVAGQILCVLFSVYYGAVSYFQKYYGEMITYLGMSAPIAVAAVVSWLRHPSRGNRAEVEVRTAGYKDYLAVSALAVAVTAAFFFILRALGTAHLIWSTVSVTTSFVAVSFSLRRSPLYALAYACNDVVLIVLWSLASAADLENISLVVCFSVFLVNDIYGFVNWLRMRSRQRSDASRRAE